MPDQADTYKCFAINEYGQATVTVVLNVIEGKGCMLLRGQMNASNIIEQ